jgi:hypothetical protein
LKDATFERFGAGSQPNRFIERYIWLGDKTTIMSLSYNEVSRTGFLFMDSKKIKEQQEQYKKEKAIEGAGKGF